MPLRAGMDIVDVGTGYGVLAFELAHLERVSVTGVDLDPAVLALAAQTAETLTGWFQPGATVRFCPGDAQALPLESASADLVTARLLLQHLAEPATAAHEFARVVRPGGYVHIFDVDDGLALSEPPPPPEVAAVEAAYARWQRSYGGDRQVGRKLARYLADAGLDIVATFVLPQAHYGTSAPGDVERSAAAARLSVARQAMLDAGVITATAFDAGVRALLEEPPATRFRVESQVVAVARKS